MTRHRHDGGPVRLLVTGFGPYPGVPVNPTGALALRIALEPRLRLAGIAAQAAIFRTTYAEVKHALRLALERTDPDVCLHLGLAPRAKTVRVEVLAENRARPLSPDASGHRPKRREILKGVPGRRRTSVDEATILAALRRAGVPAVLSRDAGAYLCNAVYFLSLQVSRSCPGRLVLFVHIPRPAPPPGRMPSTRRRPSGAPRPAPARLAKALACLAVLLAAAQRNQVRRAAPRDG